MATIEHADSIIADSTTSPSSPSRVIHENIKDNDTLDTVDSDCGPQIRPKRVARTYGRQKPREDIEATAEDDLGFRARILRTAPLDADDQVIPESDDTLPKFRFAWEDKLKAIDEGLYISGNENTTPQRDNSPPLILQDASETRKEFRGIDETNVASGDSIQRESLFDGTLPSLLSEPTPSSSQSFENDEPVAAPPKKSFGSHRRVIDSPRMSDSEDTSPKHLYAINSPKQRSSSTPPTSPLGESTLQDSLGQSGSSMKGTKKGTANKGKGKERKTKGLTKKEVIEMQKESARLLADRPVHIERKDMRSRHTIASLFNKLKPLPTPSRPDSDPILSFSSPGLMPHSSSDRASPSKRMLANTISSRAKSAAIHLEENPHRQDQFGERIRGDNTEEDIPDAVDLLPEHTQKQLRNQLKERGYVIEKKRVTELEEQKRKALEAVQHTRTGNKFSGDSDTDDDLEVEVMVSSSREDEAKSSEVRSGKQRASTISSDKKRMTSRPNPVSHKDLQEAAKPAFLSREGIRRQRHDSSVSQKELNGLLLQRADRQSGAIEAQKMDQWLKTGGVLKAHGRSESEEKLVTDWLEKGAARKSTDVCEGEEEEGGDCDDPEYDPRDSGGYERTESDVEASTPGPLDTETAFHQGIDTSDEDGDADKENHRPALRRQSARNVVESDDEDGPTDLSRPRNHTVLVPDTSFVDHSDDSSGGDKENSAVLAFSFNENKENEGVPRHQERGRVVDADSPHTNQFMPALSPPVSHVVGTSKTSREPLSRLEAEAELAFVPEGVTRRRESGVEGVLQVLHEEDKDATLTPIGSTSKSPLYRGSLSPPEPEDLDETTLVSPIGFSQLFNRDRSEALAPGPILGPGGFTQFFSQSGDVDNFFATPLKVKPQHRDAQAKEDNFEFTQPNTLLPSIKISETQRRKVDEMFGKDQEFKLDEAKRSRILSQDAASSDSNTLHFGSFVPSPIAKTPGSIRRPLETLSLESRNEDVLLDERGQTQSTRRSRLLRGPRERSSPSSSPSLVPRNAFDVLRDGASKSKQRERGERQEIGKSEYIEVEAEESDEEAMLGFGGTKGNNEEEGESEDPNMIVEGLVDDTILDDAAQAADLVLQKHMEHQAEDDAALEKLHQDAVDGKLRGKRRDRDIGVYDSDSDESDDGYSRKPPLYKKRRVDGDALEACGNNPETAPFYNAYQAALADDDLNIGQDESIDIQEDMTPDRSDDEHSEVVDPINIRRQIIEEKAKQGLRSSSPELDPENASWVDSDDHDLVDMDVRVEAGPLHPRKATPLTRSRLDHVGYRGEFEGKRTRTDETRHLKTWASHESQANTLATGRGGFSRKDTVDPSSSRKRGKLAPMKESRKETKAIARHSSLISHVEKRKGFD